MPQDILHYHPKLNPKRWERVLYYPLSRLLIAFGFVMAAAMITSIISQLIPNRLGSSFLNVILILPLSYISYRLYLRWIERRRPTELGHKGAGTELFAGIIVGTILLLFSVAIVALFGGVSVTSVSLNVGILLAFLSAIGAAWLEELLLRGIVFRILEEWLSSWIAIALSALLFGFLHATNPNATFWSSTAIALEAGILLAAAYMLTRRLWFAIGIHFSWNFVQGGIFGISVSGTEQNGFLQTELSGPIWMSGGDFGIEASLITVLLCLSLAILILARVRKKQFWLSPSWQR